MGIVNLLRTENDAQLRAARFRYVDLLRKDSEKQADVEELKRLMVALNKTAPEVAADQRVLKEIDKRRVAIKNAAMNFPQIAEVDQQEREFDAETKRITDARASDRAKIADEMARVYEIRNIGQEAVEEINQFKSDPMFAELLENEPAASPDELKPPGH